MLTNIVKMANSPDVISATHTLLEYDSATITQQLVTATAELQRRSSLIVLTVSAHDNKFTADYANTWLTAYSARLQNVYEYRIKTETT